MKFIKKPQTPLENSQTESDLLLLKEFRIGGLKTVKHTVWRPMIMNIEGNCHRLVSLFIEKFLTLIIFILMFRTSEYQYHQGFWSLTQFLDKIDF